MIQLFNYIIKKIENYFIILKIKNDHKYFLTISEPTEEQCKIAMMKDPSYFWTIINPSRNLMIYAINCGPPILFRFYKKDYDLCMYAVSKNHLNLSYISSDHFSHEEYSNIILQCLSYNGDPVYLKRIENQTPEYYLKCLNACPESYKYIKIVDSNSSLDCEVKLKAKIKLLTLIE